MLFSKLNLVCTVIEEFEIIDGSISASQIDDVYCLSFVMPNCLIHLSRLSPQEKRAQEEADSRVEIFVAEEPRGTFLNLEKDTVYYVYVEQEADQLKRDQEKMRQIAAEMEGAKKSGLEPIGMDILSAGHWESCSCIYGVPCLDEYGCKDWKNRNAVSAANGWIKQKAIEDSIKSAL